MTDDDMYHSRHCMKHCYDVMNILNENDSYGVVGTYMPFENPRYKNKILIDKFIYGDYNIHSVTGLPPGIWYLDKDAVLFAGGFRLPPGKLMGFSAWKLPDKLRSNGFKSAWIRSYKRRYVRSEHMDNIRHKFNFVNFYNDTGYNKFRTEQKGKR